MSLTTIDASKELELSYQPLLLVKFTFPDAAVLYLATHELSAAKTAAYGGNTYLGRVSSNTLDAVQQMSATGIDIPTNVKIALNDQDYYLWPNWHLTHGFRGAIVELRIVLFDIATNTFSSDSAVRFLGLCDGPELKGGVLTINASSLINLQRRMLPSTPIQPTCPYLFPGDSASQAASVNRDSPNRFCGYNPSGGRGNAGFTSCAKTSDDCKARGMYTTDGGGHQTGGFGAVTFQLPPGTHSREYTSGNWLNLRNNNNEAKYSDFFPEVLGTALVQPPVLNVFSEGNSSRGECVVSFGQITDIIQFVVSDTQLPPANDITGASRPLPKGGEIMRYNFITNGSNKGKPNSDVPWNSTGDPYGSLAAIEWVVPSQLATNGSIPSIYALVKGGAIPLPSTSNPADCNSWPLGYTENSAYLMLEILKRLGVPYAVLDIESFRNQSVLCDGMLSYTDSTGATYTAPRYSGGIVFRQRTPGAQIVTTFLRGFNAYLIQNSGPTGTLYSLGIRGTIAQQQGTLGSIPGSNYTTTIASTLADGTSAIGHVAYKFNKSNMVRLQGEEGLSIRYQPNSTIPNKIGIDFADKNLRYGTSTAWIIDTEDVSRMQGENSYSLPATGIQDYGQAYRVINTYQSELTSGNMSGNASGTMYFDLQTTIKGCRLQVGQIVLIDRDDLGLTQSPQLVAGGSAITGCLARILKVQPTNNAELFNISAAVHRDEWYTDAFASGKRQQVTRQLRDSLDRPAYPWGPNFAPCNPGSPAIAHDFYDSSISSFGVELIEKQQDASGAAMLSVQITGEMPPNTFSPLPAPTMATYGTVGGGGTMVSGSYFINIAAIDSSGLHTQCGPPTRIDITSGTTNTATAQVMTFDSTAVGYSVYMGMNPNFMSWQFDATGTPTSVTCDHWLKEGRNLPDTEFDSLRARAWTIRHSGWAEQEVNAVGSGTLTFTGAGFTVNSLTGYDVSVQWKINGGPLKVLNFRVLSNTADTLTVNPDPSAIGSDTRALVEVGDLIAFRSMASVSGMTLTDPLWDNPLSGGGLGLEVNAEAGNHLVFIAGPGNGDVYPIASNTATSITVDADYWRVTPTSDSRYIVTLPNSSESTATRSLVNNDPANTIQFKLPIQNLVGLPILVKVYAADGGGAEAMDILSPFREVYIPGSLSNIIRSQKTVTADYTLTLDDQIVNVDATAGPINITLQPASSLGGRTVTVTKIDATTNAVTVTPDGTDLISGAATQTLAAQWDSITMTSNGMA